MSALNLNKAVLCGRLTADPELKQTQSGISVTSFTLAVNRKCAKGQQQQTDFLSVIAWRQTAEFITRYFKKDSAICIVGSIQTRSRTDSNGQRSYATEVVADEAMFVDAKQDRALEEAAAPETSRVPAAYAAATAPVAPVFTDEDRDDDLPF